MIGLKRKHTCHGIPHNQESPYALQAEKVPSSGPWGSKPLRTIRGNGMKNVTLIPKIFCEMGQREIRILDCRQSYSKKDPACQRCKHLLMAARPRKPRSSGNPFTSLEPIFMMHEFKEFVQQMKDPPESAIWLAMRIDEYLCHKGEKSLDEIFGVKRKGVNPFEHEMLRVRNANMCLEVLLLCKWFELKPRDAIRAVAKKYATVDWTRLSEDWGRNIEGAVTEKTIGNHYSKWLKFIKETTAESWKPYAEADLEKRLEWLETFPKDVRKAIGKDFRRQVGEEVRRILKEKRPAK